MELNELIYYQANKKRLDRIINNKKILFLLLGPAFQRVVGCIYGKSSLISLQLIILHLLKSIV